MVLTAVSASAPPWAWTPCATRSRPPPDIEAPAAPRHRAAAHPDESDEQQNAQRRCGTLRLHVGVPSGGGRLRPSIAEAMPRARSWDRIGSRQPARGYTERKVVGFWPRGAARVIDQRRRGSWASES